MMQLRAPIVAGAALAFAACHPSAPRVDPAAALDALRLGGQYIVPRAAVAPPVRFGGISGLAALRDGRELLGVCDDRAQARVYRFRVSGSGDSLRVDPTGVIALEAARGAPAKLDLEGIALTADGHILVSSEGIGNEEPRIPPAIIEYSPDGRFIRQFEVRTRYVPNERGPIATGVRDNAGFEPLTVSPDGRLFTASELPVVQDGDAEAFAVTRTRVLEYVSANGTYRPAREFAYDLAAMEPPAFAPRFAVNGLVELLALGGDDLLALERGYVESADRSQALNRIRIFRLSLAGATDVSAIDSLRSAPAVVPVTKVLLADLNAMPGLAPPLAGLDNFEGMAWGPSAPGGRRQLLVVSDDNFSDRQVTAFLAFSPSFASRPAR